ncbi:MAG: oxidative damage protection protein [Gemmatimonadota bacterium]
MAAIKCARCGKEGQPLPYAPLRSELGERIHAEICQDCWSEWLQYQTMLINHYGLNLRDPEAKTFLTEQTERFLYGGDTEEVDTSKQGTISW